MEKLIQFARKLLKKVLSREFLSYAIFGVLTTAVNLLLFRGGLALAIPYSIANLIAIIGAKLFAYVTNKLFVFRHHCENFRALLMEMLRFIFARGFTGLLDFFGLMFAVEILSADEMIAKYVLQVLVIILNYILSRKMVFRSNKKQTDPPESISE